MRLTFLIVLSVFAASWLSGCSDLQKILGAGKYCCCNQPSGKGVWTKPEDCPSDQLCGYGGDSGSDSTAACQGQSYPTGQLFSPDRKFDTALPSSTVANCLSRSAPNRDSPALSLAFYKRTTSTPAPLLDSENAIEPDDASCLGKCAAGTTADCVSSKIDTANTESIRTLYLWVSTPDRTSIQPNELQKLFGLESDECHRGPTTLSSSGMVNDGDECVISAASDDPKLLLRLNIPKHLEGSWMSRQGSSISLRLVGKFLPTVHFFKSNGKDRHALDSDFGGRVLKVESDGHRLVVRTDAPGCIGVSF